MNFLFTSVLVLLMVAPGLAFFRAYYSGNFSIRYSRLTITDQIFRSIVPALTAQVAAFLFLQAFTPYRVSVATLGGILLGTPDHATIRRGLQLVSSQLHLVLGYHLAMLAAGALLGWGARRLVRWRKWDRRYSFLRYDNPYHYLLTGEIFETKDFRGVIELKDAKHIDFIFIDVLVKMEKGNLLYSGILVNYQLAADGGLKSLYLKAARRKQMNTRKADGTETQRMPGSAETQPQSPNDADNPYYPVDGDVLMIPSEQVLNLNLTYYIDTEDAEKEGDRQNGKPAHIDITREGGPAA